MATNELVRLNDIALVHLICAQYGRIPNHPIGRGYILIVTIVSDVTVA